MKVNFIDVARVNMKRSIQYDVLCMAVMSKNIEDTYIVLENCTLQAVSVCLGLFENSSIVE